jgi:streptogramin lyase
MNPAKAVQKVLLSFSFSALMFLLLLSVGKLTIFAVSNNFNSSINIPSSYVNIGKPGGMVMLPDGNIWYMDILNGRLVKYNPTTNTILRTVGRSGYGEGEFGDGFRSMTRDSDGNLYVISLNSVVMKFDSNGGYIRSWDMTQGNPGETLSWGWAIHYDTHSNAIFIASTYYPDNCKVYKYTTDMQYISSFGTPGTGDGQFSCPSGIGTDAAGNIYVADGSNERVQVFDSSFTFKFKITTWTGGSGGFNAPEGIVVLSDGTIVVASQNSNNVVEFDHNGSYIRTLGGQGTFNGNMQAPEFLVKDSANNIYVSDWSINSITKFSEEGTFLSVLKNASPDECKLYGATSVAYDSSGNMYVMDVDANVAARVQKWNADGSCAGEVIPKSALSGSSYFVYIDPSNRMFISGDSNVRVFEYNSETEDWEQTAIFGSGGSGDGQFNQARGIGVNTTTGHIYVADLGNHRVEEFDSDFVFVRAFAAGWEEGDGYVAGEVIYPNGLVVTSDGYVIVVDRISVQKFTSTGGYTGVIGIIGTEGGADETHNLPGSYWTPVQISIDSADNIYVSDTQWQRVTEYDSSGDQVARFGTYGSGQGQYNEPGGVGIDPVTGNVTVADGGNSRVESYTTGKVRIYNLIPSANVVIRTHEGGESDALDAYAGQSLSEQVWDPVALDLTAIPARMYFGEYVVADFTVDLSVDRNWSAVNVLTLPHDSKALVVDLSDGETPSAPGISATHSLYLYRYVNQTTATVCPEATTWSGVSADCPNGVTLTGGFDPVSGYTLSQVRIGSTNYWKIDGLTGTGAFSTLFETSFLLQDLMTREQVATTSSHDLTFGTTYGLTHDGDTIVVTFTNDWDLSGLTVGDLSLVNGSTVLALDAAPGTDTWGAVIDNGTHTITFTAPTDGTGYIAASSTVHVLIADSVLANPVDTGTYEIDIRLLSDDGEGGQNAEVGSVNVPIVDSDQVDVTGYVNNYLAFDIDTGTVSNVECSYTDCQLYNGAIASATNYTVDLGELSSLYVNKSQDAPVSHSDGGSGLINSIYLDLTSNALNGTMVNVTSANGGLQGPNSLIASVVAGQNITANSGKYGFDLPESSSTHGTVYTSDGCTDPDMYCALVAEPTWVFNVNGPVDGARVRMDIAAAAAYTDSPGSYTDTLTFVATGTF